MAKRFRYSIRKNYDIKKDDEDSDDNRMHESDHILELDKIKKEKESDKSETDSVGMPNTMESELEVQKTDETSVKSTNSSAASSPATSVKSKGSRLMRAVSPGSTGKQKAAIDMSNPAFKEPFKYGWKRELVFRASSDSSLKRMADIYYYTPKGKKVRSFREVAEFRKYILLHMYGVSALTRIGKNIMVLFFFFFLLLFFTVNTKELTIDNFTFFKEPIGIDDPEKEIIRDAKRIRVCSIEFPLVYSLSRSVGYVIFIILYAGIRSSRYSAKKRFSI